MTLEVEIMKIDPLRILSMEEVCKRTGYSRRTIHRYLASDIQEKTPDRRFPRPMRRSGGRVEWREATLMEWLQSREA